jgi:NADPH:quinone reductase-like Zn-dependent oxidoreductase
MKAIVSHRYGSPDDLAIREIDKPDIGDDGVLVRVGAASVNAYDWHMMRGKPYVVRLSEGLRRPSTAVGGVDVAGHVEAVGRDVTEFRPGDPVFGARDGAFAEFVAGRERNFATIPKGFSFEQAAAVPTAAVTALQALRDKAQVQPGQTVLVNGASGGVGTFAVQIARSFGARVTGVCSTANVDLVRSLGAERVIDYTRDDFTRDGARYEVIIDVAGNRSLLACRRAMKPDGTFVVVGAAKGNWVAPLARPAIAVLLSKFGSRRMLPFLARHNHADLLVLRTMMETGSIAPVIDRCYPLSETPEALRYLEQGHARGKVVITI